MLQLPVYSYRYTPAVASKARRIVAGRGQAPTLWAAVGDDAIGVRNAPHLAQPARFGSTMSLARDLAEGWHQRLTALLPSLISRHERNHDLWPAVVTSLTLRLGLKELPPLLAFLQQPLGGGEVVLLNCPFGMWQEPVFRRGLPGLGLPARMSLWSIPGGAPAISHLVQPPTAVTAQTGGRRVAAVVLCGAASELDSMRGVVAALRPQGPLALVAKNDSAASLEVCQALAEPDRGDVVIPRAAYRHGTQLLAPQVMARLHRRMTALPPQQRLGLATVLRTTFGVMRQADDMTRLLHAFPTDIIIGALDRSTLGPIVAAVRPPGTQVIDMQHGTLIPFAITDLFRPDLVLAWNQASVDVLRADGLSPTVPVAVVGNPRWEALAALPVHPERARAHTRALQIAVFLQPVKGPLLALSTMVDLWGALTELLRADPRVTLIVRPHPSDSTPGVPRALVADPRVTVSPPDAEGYGQLLTRMDAAISVYSTALADAAAAGTPAISFDPEGIFSHVTLDFAKTTTVCRTTSDLITVVAGLPLEPQAISRAPSDTGFAARVAEVLGAHALPAG